MELLASFDLPHALAGLLVGVAVGLTGVGGGSLMTPLLVLIFNTKVQTAVGTDLLFAAVNLVRAHGVPAEDALRAANAKFERRFRAMEALAAAQDADFAALDLAAQEALWQQVKASEPYVAP